MVLGLLAVSWLVHCSTVATFDRVGEGFIARDYLEEQTSEIVDGGILTRSLKYEEFTPEIATGDDFPLGRIFGRKTRFSETDSGELRILRPEQHGLYTHLGTYTRFRSFGEETVDVFCRGFR